MLTLKCLHFLHAVTDSEASAPIMRRKRRGKAWQKKGDGRFIKRCPIPGCNAKPQVRLAQHIRDYHKNVSKGERLQLTNTARVVGQNPKAGASQRPKGVRTIDTLFRAQLEKEKQPPKSVVLPEPAKGTRSDPRFDLAHPEMKRFTAYLQSLDGERKPEQEARSIATDVSKFLKYASPEKINWLAITDPIKVRQYLELLEQRSGVGIDGRLTKLQRLAKVLSYITQELFPNNSKLFHKCQLVAERYSKWRKVMNREKSYKSQLRLEKTSQNPRPLSQLMALTRHKPLWENIAELLVQADTGVLSPKEQRTVVAALITLIVQKNWQRPGVANLATLQEFRSSEKIIEGGVTMMIMRVARHKTARQGPANVVMTVDEHKLVRKYVNRIRKNQDPTGLREELFLLPGAKPVTNSTILMQRLGKRYGISIETPTMLRKVGATATIDLPPGEASLVQKHMSHTPGTAAKYYQLTLGGKQAAKAHLLRRRVEETQVAKEPQLHRSETESESEDVESESEDVESETITEVKGLQLRVEETPVAKEPQLHRSETESESEDEVESETITEVKGLQLRVEETQVAREPQLHRSETESESDEVESEAITEVKGLQLQKKRQLYTNKEDALIKSFFRKYTASRTTPSLKICRQFIAQHHIKRTAKQVQDHVRQIICRR